jgi:hypothetical protein
MPEYHGQELADDFLDKLWVSICDRIPDNVWVPIRKNEEQVVAGIKHFIDVACYGSSFDISFNSDYTKFKKHVPKSGNKRLTDNPMNTNEKSS